MASKRALSLLTGVNEQITDSDVLVTGRVQTVDGTEADPALRFQSEATGLLLSAAGTLGFSVAGTQYLSLSSTELTLSAGNLKLPDTPGGGASGVLEFNNAPTMHVYGTTSIFVGSNAGNFTAGAATNVVVVGDGALAALTNGNNTIAIGAGALVNATNGALNTIAIGSNAGSGITSSSQTNIVIGHDAMTAAANLQENTIVGNSAYQDGTNGSNVVVGYRAAYNATSSSQNVIAGSEAVETGILTGDRNVILGFSAARNATSAGDSVFIGNESGEGTTTGQRSVAVGGDSLMANNTGDDNIAIGYRAMADDAIVAIGAMSNNVAIGTEALRYIEAATAGNVAIGFNALRLVQGSGATTNNVAIGYQAGSTADGANSCVYIGYQSGLNNATSNRLIIENSNDITTPLIDGDFSGKVLTLNAKVTPADDAARSPLNITERSAAPTSPATHDVYIDDGTNTGTGSPGFRRYTGAGWEDMGSLAASGALPGIEQILFVNKTSDGYTADGTIAKPYKTIGAAVTAATALTPAIGNRIAIFIYPGIYDETVSTADAYVEFIGLDKASTIVNPTTGRALNVGDSNIRFTNLTFETTDTNSVVYFTAGSLSGIEFDNCHFFVNNAAGGAFQVPQSDVSIIFRDCHLQHVDTTDDIYIDNAPAYGGKVEFYTCKIEGQVQSYDKDLYMYGCHLECLASRNLYVLGDASKIIRIVGCTIETLAAHGTPVYIDTACDWSLLGCSLKAAGTGNEVQSGGDYPGTVKNCAMEIGMASSVRLLSPIRNIGGSVDFYEDFQQAIDSIDSGDQGIVVLHENITATEQAVDSGATVTIKGNGYTLTASSTYCFRSTASSTLIVDDLNLSGGGIALSTTSSTMKLKNVNIDQGRISIQAGADGNSKLIMDRVICDNPEATYPALEFDDADAFVYVFDSYLQGASGQPAIRYDTDNDNLSMANTAAFHGDGGANNPISNPTAATTYKSHHCTFGVAPEDNANLSNDIDSGQRYNTIDPDADYSWAL